MVSPPLEYYVAQRDTQWTTYPSPLIDEQPRAVTIIQLLRQWFIPTRAAERPASPAATRRDTERVSR